MAHPFDLRSVLLAKHAQHIVLIHFPIALFISGTLIDWYARLRKQPGLVSVAYINITIAAFSVLPVIATGLLAWHFALDDQKLKGTLLLHLLTAAVATILILLSWWLQWRSHRFTSSEPATPRLLIETVGVLAIGLTAHLGGYLSGVNL
jgi:uncharacterized membrane protein